MVSSTRAEGRVEEQEIRRLEDQKSVQLTILSGWAARNAARENILGSIEEKTGYTKSIEKVGLVNDGEEWKEGEIGPWDVGTRKSSIVAIGNRMTYKSRAPPRPALDPSPFL